MEKKLNSKTGMVLEALVWIGLIQVMVPIRAYAYLDPGTGSYMLQVLMGLLVGLLFTIKTFWKNIKSSTAKLLKRRGRN